MKKTCSRICCVAVVASMLALLGGCYEEKQPQKPASQFAVVQLAELYQESRVGKAGFERLSSLETKAQELLKNSLAELEKAHAEGDDAKAAEIEQGLQEHVAFMQDVIRQDQEHIGNVVQTVLKNTLEKYRKEHGLFGVFSADTVLSYSEEIDVTTEVKTMLDKVEPAFGKLPSLELPRLPEPANALPLEEGKVAETQPASE